MFQGSPRQEGGGCEPGADGQQQGSAWIRAGIKPGEGRESAVC